MSRLIVLLLGLSCGPAESPKNSTDKPEVVVADTELLEASWPIRYATSDSRAPYEGKAGWIAYFNRDYSQSLSELSGPAQARVHLELSAIYRQATRLHAHATTHLFESNSQPSDPKSAGYLLGVSKLILGEPEAAASLLKEHVSVEGPFSEQAKQWLSSVERGSLELEDISSFSLSWPEPASGATLSVENIPHHQLPLEGEVEGTMDVTDSSTLWFRAQWHEAAAKLADPASSNIIDAMLNPYRLPFETPSTVPVETLNSDAWLFLSYTMSAGDIDFLNAAITDGTKAITAFKSKSIYAATLEGAVVDGNVSVEQSLVLASRLKEQMLGRIEKTNGTLDPVHSIFAEQAEIGVLHAAMLMADSNDQYRDAGELRLNMRDLVQKSPKNPVYFLELAAWDTGNKSPLRPQEILHRFSSDLSALEAARIPLDSLHIRISRGSGPGPLH